MTISNSTTLILGGGIGGWASAHALRRRLPRRHRIVLIEKRSTHVFSPSLPWLIMGWRQPEEVARSFASLQRRGVEVVEAEVTAFDPVTRTAHTAQGSYTGDTVIVSLGAALDHEAIPGWKPAVLNFYCLGGAQKVREAVIAFSGGRIGIVIASTPYKCPAAPYELALLLDDYFHRQKGRERIELHFYTPEPAPMPAAGPLIGKAVEALLEERRIFYHPNAQLIHFEPETKTAVFKSGDRVHSDLWLGVPPHRPPAVMQTSGLVGEKGWVPVDRNSLASRFPGVYVIGDLTGIPIAGGKMLPKAGVFAHAQADVVAWNIAAKVLGDSHRKAFDGNGECFIEVGGGRAGFARGNFYAEPAPTIHLHAPARWWHWSKTLLEWRWWHGWL